MSDAIAPGFLVAVPHLLDPNFDHAVVFLVQHDDEGAMGLVVNKETPLLLKDLCNDQSLSYAGDPTKRVRMGGPVQPEQGFVLYDPTDRADVEGESVLRDLGISASPETLERLCDGDGVRFHCYAGYAGWGPGQLEDEIRRGSWILAPADAATVFEVPADRAWRTTLERLGITPELIVPGGTAEA